MAFTDNFTEASDTNLESHTPSGGTAWSLTGTTGAAVVGSVADALKGNTTSASYYVCDDQGSADHYTQAVLSTLTTLFPNNYIACRLVDASNFIGWRLAGTGSSGSRLTKMVSGVATDLITHQGTASHTYKVSCSGATIQLYDNGAQVGTDQTVTDFSTETSQGLRIGSSSTTTWIDDFEAGALGGGGTIITRSLSDNVSVLDSAGEAREKTRLALDSISVSDESFHLINKVRLLIDNLDVLDSLSKSIYSGGSITISRLLSDSINVLDTDQRYLELSRLINEVLSVNDSSSTAKISLRLITDIVDASDELLRKAILTRLISDALTTSDSLSSNIPTIVQAAIAIVLRAIEGQDIEFNCVSGADIYTGYEQ